MGIKGFQGTSLLDFPGRVASLVFFGGCNLTCAFCHNPALVLSADDFPDYPPEALLEELAERRGFIDGVVISGGEPTLAPELPSLLREIKALDLEVKLDTNGLAPGVLAAVLEAGLVDYVALDLKTAPERYGELHPGPVAVSHLLASVGLLLGAEVDYELRTTCVPGLVAEAEIRALGEKVRGARRWRLQQFVPGHALAETARLVEPYPEERLLGLAALAREYVPDVELRGC